MKARASSVSVFVLAATQIMMAFAEAVVVAIPSGSDVSFVRVYTPIPEGVIYPVPSELYGRPGWSLTIDNGELRLKTDEELVARGVGYHLYTNDNTYVYTAEPGALGDSNILVAAEFYSTATNLVEIPASFVEIGNRYKTTLEAIFGEGAVTNRGITEAVVAITLSLSDDITADTGMRLKTWSDLIAGYWGTTFTFPYGETSYEVTTNRLYILHEGVEYFKQGQ